MSPMKPMKPMKPTPWPASRTLDELDVNNFDAEFTDMDPVLTPTTAVSPSARTLFRGFSFVAPEPLFDSRLFPLPSEIDDDGDASNISAAPPPLLTGSPAEAGTGAEEGFWEGGGG